MTDSQRIVVGDHTVHGQFIGVGASPVWIAVVVVAALAILAVYLVRRTRRS